MTTLKLHGLDLSGHSHRAQLFLSLLGLEAEVIRVDLLNGAHKQPEFLAKNLFGQIPVLEDGETVIADSNAILVYLAQKYDQSGNWYPKDPQTAAEIQRFLSVAAGPVANGPASARLVNVFKAQLDHERAISIAHAMLSVLDQHLEGREWLVGDHPTIADIANYTYIAHAPEGGVSLEAYPQVRNWLARIEQLPGFVAMPSTAVGLAS
ncbi:glutathione S-transferase [Pontibacterium granulatum]|uniref:glutathione S-transferase family protein n=1 Tax=Pontibacterium granulatum TaxID=2036029 RepID=UPI00249ADDE0|nr:glutathione S-transferase [Pontibacterium granulatum]MDI3324381.1 glutathione S-transferase [Pontibacterium granulatum]